MPTLGAALLAGAAGAVSLNLMHESARLTVPNSPRVDVIGMRAVAAIARAVGAEPPDNLRETTLAADLAANALYFSAVAGTGPSNAIAMGGVLGLAAGIGAVVLPGPMRLGEAEVSRTVQTQIMTAGMYFAAGLIAGTVYQAVSSRASDQRSVSGGRS